MLCEAVLMFRAEAHRKMVLDQDLTLNFNFERSLAERVKHHEIIRIAA